MQQLKIKNLVVKSQNRVLVKSINLEVEKGEILAVVGKSGSGKTITFKAATGLLSSEKFKIAGEIIWDEKLYAPKEMQKLLGKEISYVMQNPMTAFNPVFTIRSHCRETLMQHLKVNKKEADKIIKEWFEKFGLHDVERVLESYCYELSGGMLQRVMLSLAMAVGSKMIIADEPTTALDTITQKEIIRSFKRLNEEYGVTIVFISHDFAIVSQIANHMVVISDGKTIEYGKTKDLLMTPKSECTKKMLKELIENDYDY
ncbi:ABC transporter ATP-binding protein [Crassaminicella profunda]|uniref:ATP-binding cassette domain-containing protein n=1 Tax=Crassaminicella profunda TaxID=1286698 RepID=UPI001CA6E092|nr:ABC transporter ATP-binding protein [Crassaminicella profunda]QZY53864.1 ABC transporter ATP-binding protein [Crassaminicella profunda]